MDILKGDLKVDNERKTHNLRNKEYFPFFIEFEESRLFFLSFKKTSVN